MGRLGPRRSRAPKRICASSARSSRESAAAPSRTSRESVASRIICASRARAAALPLGVSELWISFARSRLLASVRLAQPSDSPTHDAVSGSSALRGVLERVFFLLFSVSTGKITFQESDFEYRCAYSGALRGGSGLGLREEDEFTASAVYRADTALALESG